MEHGEGNGDARLKKLDDDVAELVIAKGRLDSRIDAVKAEIVAARGDIERTYRVVLEIQLDHQRAQHSHQATLERLELAIAKMNRAAAPTPPQRPPRKKKGARGDR